MFKHKTTKSHLNNLSMSTLSNSIGEGRRSERRGEVLCALLCICAVCVGCDDSEAETPTGWTWAIPQNYPEPNVPHNNPMTADKVQLGRFLFYDKRLSINGEMACASCHIQEKAFTDGREVSVGTTGDVLARSSMALGNVAYTSRLTWANHLLSTLEAQAMIPLFGEQPIEHGLAGQENTVIAMLKADARYQELFPKAFPDDADPFSVQSVVHAISAFERSLLTFNSAYDRYTRGDKTAISDAAKRGMLLFFSERFECFHCHGGLNFTDSVDHQNLASAEVAFHNTALYNIDGFGGYPPNNTGLFNLTKKPSDMGRFRAPTLRNIALTAPYMHDGSIPDLSGVIDHYAAGGRTITEGPYAGIGSESPLKSNFMVGFVVTDEERADIIAFLESLTDQDFVTNPAFSDPFVNP
jgi:cytochrome c peroxidase